MHTTTPEITVYWRPGCPFCANLGRQLDRAGLSTTWIDIWQDPTAAAFVRSVANGNETVPTVVIAGQAMVNPHVDAVKAALDNAAPDAVPSEEETASGTEPTAWQRLRHALLGRRTG